MQREPPLHILSPPPSDELLDFLRQCLRVRVRLVGLSSPTYPSPTLPATPLVQRDPAQRPSAEELLSHAFIERHAAPMPASTADPATDEPMAQAAAAAAAHGAAAAAAGGTSDADGSLFWYERPVGAPLTEASLGGGVAGHSARARSPSAADAASGLDDDDAGCSASESVSAASVEEDGAHALTWSQTDKVGGASLEQHGLARLSPPPHTHTLISTPAARSMNAPLASRPSPPRSLTATGTSSCSTLGGTRAAG